MATASRKIGSSPPPVLYDTSPPWRPRPKTARPRKLERSTRRRRRRAGRRRSIGRRPRSGAGGVKKTKKAPVSRPVLCTEEDVEDSDTEAARLFACTDTSAPRLVEAFDDVKEVGVVFPIPSTST